MSTISSLHTDVIPDALRSYDQWVCWTAAERDGKATKLPLDPATGELASATDPDTWGAFQDALDALEEYEADGIGFVFTDDDPFVGVDLDNCRDPEDGSLAPWASGVIAQLGSYTERSPSGTGAHVILKGEVPGNRNRKGNIEMYDTARYFTMTGAHIADAPQSIGRRPRSLKEVYWAHLGEAESTAETAPPDSTSKATPTSDIDLDNQELIEKARSAANGESFDALWKGSIAGYDSHSEADMALACHLAFWTGGDAGWIDDLFRSSGLMREKWDKQHYADGSTYGEKTIARACDHTDTYYNPDQYSSDQHSSSTPSVNVDDLVPTDKNRPMADSHTQNTPTAEDANASEGPTASSTSISSARHTPEPAADDTAASGEIDRSTPSSPDLQERVAEQQAAIEILEQRLVDQQATIDELHATVADVQAQLNERTHIASSDESATDTPDEENSPPSDATDEETESPQRATGLRSRTRRLFSRD